MSIAQVYEEREKGLTMTINSRLFVLATSILDQAAPQDNTYRELYTLKQDLRPLLIVPPVFDTAIIQQCFVALENPNTDFSYHYMKPMDKRNTGNHINRGLSFVIGTDPGTSYIYVVNHMTSFNLGFPMFADWFVRGQPDDVAKEYYKAMMQTSASSGTE